MQENGELQNYPQLFTLEKDFQVFIVVSTTFRIKCKTIQF